jgi:hypothetical protein
MDDVLDVMRRCTRIPKSLLDAIPGKTDLGYRIKGDWCTLALAAMRLDEKIRDKDAPPAGKIERPLAYLLGVFNEIKAPDFPPGERDDLAGKVERLRERAQEQTPTKGDFDESSYRVVVQGWIARAVETNVPAREIGPRIMGHIDKLADANPMAGTWEFQARERIATEEITAFLVGRGAS